MLPNQDNPQPGADSVWPPTMFHARSAGRSTYVPHTFHTSSDAVQRLMGIYAEIMERSARHIDPMEGIQWDYDHLSPDELVIIGHVFLALAQWKPNELTETPGLTRGNQDGAGDSGAEFPGCNSVTEFPETPKMPTLAHVGGGKL